MRKEYGKVLRQAFPARLKEWLPQFELYKEKSEHYSSAEQCFRWQARDDPSRQ